MSRSRTSFNNEHWLLLGPIKINIRSSNSIEIARQEGPHLYQRKIIKPVSRTIAGGDRMKRIGDQRLATSRYNLRRDPGHGGVGFGRCA